MAQGLSGRVSFRLIGIHYSKLFYVHYKGQYCYIPSVDMDRTQEDNGWGDWCHYVPAISLKIKNKSNLTFRFTHLCVPIAAIYLKVILWPEINRCKREAAQYRGSIYHSFFPLLTAQCSQQKSWITYDRWQKLVRLNCEMPKTDS